MTSPAFARSPRVAVAIGRRLYLAMALALMAQQAHAADTCAAVTGDAAASTAQRLLDALVETNGVPGMGAAVWRDGDVAWTGCAGWSDVAARAPVQRDTVFRLASVSKLIAATAAAKLAEEGRLDLDAPVAGVLPWLRNDWAPINVRQLAAHVSGLPHYQAVDAQRGHAHYPTSRDAVGLFANRKLLSAPGTAYSYSSWGYTLIGAVIEARSGQHFLDYVSRHVTHGLDIHADGEQPAARVSRLYAVDGGTPRELPRDDFSYTWPGGGLAATPEALVRFGGRMLDNRIVNADTWQAMLRPARLANGNEVREGDYALGLGWRIAQDADGARIAHHAGITNGARSALVLWPDQDAAAGVLSNAQWVSSIDSTAMLLAAPFRPRPPGLHAAACPIAARRYAGTLAAKTLEGTASFHVTAEGRCEGVLAGNAFNGFFERASAWPGRTLRVVSLSSDGGLARAALVTPFGLYDLRAQDDGRWSAQLANTRLELSL